jgi:regulator of protease activity HflC (stomatin/prohibitin superfamily)
VRLFSRRPGRQLQGSNKPFSQMALLLLLLAYWLFLWQLERIDYSLAPPSLWLRLQEYLPASDLLLAPLDPFVGPLAEILHFRIIRIFVPLIVGWWLAKWMVTTLLQSFYELPDRNAARALLKRLEASSQPNLPGVGVSRADFAEEREKNDLLRLGGPGRIMVGLGDAVVTERNARFERTLGPGVHALGRFEYPKAVIDVRPQERETVVEGLITSDGIELSAEISVTFEVSRGDQVPTREEPFPFDVEAVRRLAYARTNVGDGQVSSWERVVPGITGGKLKDIIAEYKLDELILPDDSPMDMHRRLHMEMERRARAALRNFGVELRGARLGRLELDESITSQYEDYWQAYWKKQSRLKQADGEAAALEEREIARAEAEAVMIQAIVEAVQRARQSGQVVDLKEVVALRLVEALETMAQQSQQVLPLPGNLPLQLGYLRQELASQEPVGREEDRSREPSPNPARLNLASGDDDDAARSKDE